MLTLPPSLPLFGAIAVVGVCVLCFALYVKFFRLLLQKPPLPSPPVHYSSAQQILPRVWLGSSDVAQDYDFLKAQNITHILNVAGGADSRTPVLEQISVRDLCLTRLSLPIRDVRRENITKYFTPAFSFIDSAIENDDESDVRVFIPDSDQTSSDTPLLLCDDDSSLSYSPAPVPAPPSPVLAASRPGAVLVHCVAGISRSPTIVIAYMMHRLRCRLVEAYIAVKFLRSIIRPNRGFLSSLISFELELFPGTTPTTQHALALAAYKLEALKLKKVGSALRVATKSAATDTLASSVCMAMSLAAIVDPLGIAESPIPPPPPPPFSPHQDLALEQHRHATTHENTSTTATAVSFSSATTATTTTTPVPSVPIFRSAATIINSDSYPREVGSAYRNGLASSSTTTTTTAAAAFASSRASRTPVLLAASRPLSLSPRASGASSLSARFSACTAAGTYAQPVSPFPFPKRACCV